MCAPTGYLGFESVTKGDTVFRDLVLARIIEPTSKIDAERVLGEVGVEAASYATLKRRLPAMPSPPGANRWPRHVQHMGGWAGQPGALRRLDAVLRDRRR